MRPSRRILGSFVVAPVLAIALAGSTLAAGPYTLSGFETSLTSVQTWCSQLAPGVQADVSTFAGVATTTRDYGTWAVAICHSHLTTTPATIYGGPFSYKGSTVPSITGTFIGGSVTPRTASGTCPNQVYNVSGSVLLSSPSTTTARFTAVLTHYRTLLFGRWCIVYAATVRGTFGF
jgi:hypothetical protein